MSPILLLSHNTYHKIAWSHFFYYDKIWNGKRYPFANVKIFCHLDRANWIQTALQTCNLFWAGQFISYKSINWFLLNLPLKWQILFTFAKNKKISFAIFCHFDFWHQRRNGFWVGSQVFVEYALYTSLHAPHSLIQILFLFL